MFKPCEPEPWRLSGTGKVTRVPKARANLNARQERFVEEYLKHGNGTKAAISAGYPFSSAAVQASRLLKNETVREKIQARQIQLQQSNQVLVNNTLRELSAIAFADPGPLFDRKWNLLPPDKVPAAARRALASVNISQSVRGGVHTVQIKFVDKGAILDTIARCLGVIPMPIGRGRSKRGVEIAPF